LIGKKLGQRELPQFFLQDSLRRSENNAGKVCCFQSSRRWYKLHDRTDRYQCIEMTPGANLYSTEDFMVFVANTVLEFPTALHTHSEYEFAMPLTADSLACADGRPVLMERNKLTPFNSLQVHGVDCDTRIDKMICIHCARDYLQDLSLREFAQAEVVFENISFDPGSKLRYLLGLFVDESIAKHTGYEVMLQNLASMLVTEILRRSWSNLHQLENGAEEQLRLRRAADFLREQYMLPITIDDAAAAAGMSSSHFIRSFREYSGKTPYAFLTDIRMARALELLRQSDLSITRVALACGFTNPGHFSTLFRRRLGVSPTGYRRSLI
jgi:AraC family transcriptional regulator